MKTQTSLHKRKDFKFTVSREPRLASFWGSLETVISREKQPAPKYAASMFLGINKAWFQTPAKSLAGSSILNILAVFIVVLTIQSSAPASGNSDLASSRQDWIYYTVPRTSAGKLPKIAPAGPGGTPGQGSLTDKRPPLGSTAFHPTLSAISRPLHPDNTHQTILQPKAPADTILTQDFDLPNILPKAMAPLPPAPKTVTWKAPKANQKTTKVTTEPPPPTIATPNPDSTLALLGPTTTNPALAVAPPPAASQASTTSDSNAGNVAGSQQDGLTSGDASGVVVLSTAPSSASGTVALPFGNRMGSFSISPNGNSSGSPNGTVGGTPGGGSGGAGAGGNGSVGIGPGNSGGGGGSAAGKGMFSISGTDGTGGGGNALHVLPRISDMVIPIPPGPHVRKNSLTVSTGPMGGGGLGVYQALECGKIYTIFLPMPGANWTLQYCGKDNPGPKLSSGASQSTTVYLSESLVPPEPELEFDFQRLPVPPEKTGKMIVLKGEIKEDGTVTNVKVYAGVVQRMDEAARLAFSEWKFVPAMRSGKPVSVSVLVGIVVATR